MLKLVWFVVLIGLSAASKSDPLNFVDVFRAPGHQEELGYRLPNNTEPLRYDITLTTHIHLGPEYTDEERFAFSGEVLIHLRATEVTSLITLQHRQLNINYAALTRGLEPEPIQEWNGPQLNYDEEFEFLEFDVAGSLDPDQVYTLYVSYTGELRDLSGFYRSSYTDENGVVKWLATTQFEMTDARHAFPCYDEPGIRAPMGLTIIHGDSYFALANTPVKSKEPAEDTYVF